ncbi:MAG: hypothetical protein L7G99_02435 [Vulcanisaeta sp.]|nr:hypothetical protein [Vulcanisaeta sp.]
MKLRAALLMLNAVLDYLGSSVLEIMPKGFERELINKDTEKSLRDYFNIDGGVSIRKTNNDVIITMRTNQSLTMSMLVSCRNHACECYVSEEVVTARGIIVKYRDLIIEALSRLGRLFNVEPPRVLLTHDPTVFGKVLSIRGEEVIALSIWDVLRTRNLINKDELSVSDIVGIIDTAVHEFLHYLLDRKRLITIVFTKVLRRVPSVFDDGVIHELVTWTLTPAISRYVAQCIKYGVADGIVTDNSTHLIRYPVRRRHVVVAREVINELLSFLSNGCNSPK